MLPGLLRLCFIFLVCVLSSSNSFSQNSCPENIDFSRGDFTKWSFEVGQVFNRDQVNTVVWTGDKFYADRFEMIPPGTDAKDYWAPVRQNPFRDSYTVKLGNDFGGAAAEGLSYTFTIPPTAKQFSLLYNYAVVFQDPSHKPYEQPRFRARVIDVLKGTEISCYSFDFAASRNLPGFKTTGVFGIVYKDWSAVSVDLSGLAGRTLRLEFITSDCVFEEHFGYAYINVSSQCNNAVLGGFYCDGDPEVSFIAPYGFEGYTWYKDNNFNSIIGNAQQLVLNASNVKEGEIYPVIVSPYFGYGCVDTLFAVVGKASKPIANAGMDKTTCSKVPVKIGSKENKSYSYLWSPAQYVSDSSLAAPFTRTNIRTATDLIVKTTDKVTLCKSFDTVRINPLVVDTTSSMDGRTLYCPSEPITTSLTVNNNIIGLNWYNGTIPTGSSGREFKPLTTGNYWAELSQYGCIDSTRTYTIGHYPNPRVSFYPSKEVQCLQHEVSFINTTTIAGNQTLTFTWKSSDGAVGQSTDWSRIFNETKDYAIKLIATSPDNCSDSSIGKVKIISSCIPVIPSGFTPNNDGKNDLLRPRVPGAKSIKRFAVYNRYGEVIFQTMKEGEGWDGKQKGKPLPTGVFVWVVEYISDENRTIVDKGFVTLIR